MRCRPDCCASQVMTLWRYTNTAWTKKVGPHAHDHNSVKSQQIWKKIYWNIYLVKWILKIPPHFAYVATLLCETLMSAINDKLQGSVATYLRCGCIVNNQIRKSLLLSLSVKFFQIGEYLAKLQARTWLSHALSSSFSSVLARRAKCMRQPRSCL